MNPTRVNPLAHARLGALRRPHWCAGKQRNNEWLRLKGSPFGQGAQGHGRVLRPLPGHQPGLHAAPTPVPVDTPARAGFIGQQTLAMAAFRPSL